MSNVDERRTYWVRVRMALVAAGIATMFLAVVGRVYYLQAVQGEDLEAKAVGHKERQIKVKAKRGNILDRNGVELAVSVNAPSVFVHPHQIEDPDAAAKLADALNMELERVQKKLASTSSFVWIKRQSRPHEADAVRKLKLRGVGITPESKRFYPLRERAGQLLGFVGIDGKGLEGLERRFNADLSGGEYALKGYRDARGRTLMTDSTPEFNEFEGKSVVLTIDERIQAVAERSLKRQVEEFNAKGGYAIAVDVKTGEILAMANTPSFDPNRFGSFTSADWRMRNVTDTFEPGSTFKPMLLAAALEEKTVNLNTRIDCEKGRIKIGRYTIRDSHPSDILTAAETIKESSNICSYKIAQTLGRERFYKYIKAFGFGRSTGVGVRGEQPGLVWPPDRWAEVSFANIAFGQGLTSTPLQVTMGLSALANGGKLMKPRLIKKIVDKEGNVVSETKPQLVRQVVSADAARKATWAMSLVTTEGGTGTRAALEHFTVAGKTGTAQKVNPETRRYDPHMWVASFVGFAPAEDPEVIVAVMVDEPRGSHYGGVVSAPAFVDIMTQALALRGTMPLPENERFKLDVEEEPDQDKPESIELDEQYIAAAPEVIEDTPDTVPNLQGLSLRKAILKAREWGLTPKVEGWGRVVSQHPTPGSELTDETELSVVLSPATKQSLMAEEPSMGTKQ